MSIAPASVLQTHERSISYRRLGQGKRKILFFHGFPGSSAQIFPFAEYLDTFDLEIVCLDRPGYNNTDLGTTGEPFKQANQDTNQILQHLQWKQFEVISVSGGTPYLFSFIGESLEFVTKITIISGLGPIKQPDFSKILSYKSQLSLQFIPFTPEAFFKLFLKHSKLLRAFLTPSSSDLKVLQNLKARQVLETALHEGFKKHGAGPKQDALTYLSAWNIKTEKITKDIQIWHGAEDQIIPVGMAQQLSKVIPQAKLNILPGEGHYSLAFNYIAKILTTNIESV